MSCLLDTHIFFWWITSDARLQSRHRSIIQSRDEPVFVSAVAGWEIAIKVKIGKWPEAAVLLPGLADKVRAAGLQLLDVTLEQAERAGSMDLIHRDPFDRILAAQALSLDIPVATVDPAFAMLGCRVA